MYYLVYVSSASRTLGENELVTILQKSRVRNTADNITGMLLHKDDSFMQVLEGDRVDVAKTFERIGRDKRHSGLIVLREGETDSRSFPEWSMGFRSVKTSEFKDFSGFVKFESVGFTDTAFVDNPHIAITALKSFSRR